jgi:hypothetical protein
VAQLFQFAGQNTGYIGETARFGERDNFAASQYDSHVF